MRTTSAVATIALALLSACSGAGNGTTTGRAGSASVSLHGATFQVSDVTLTMETGEGAWFRIDGQPAGQPEQECMPGLDAGLSLYGDLPSSTTKPIDLVGKRLKVDFTGDGDEANFCFPGMGGLAGAEDAWVTIESVNGDTVAFTMTGSFKVYDENGDGPVESVSARGTAVVGKES